MDKRKNEQQGPLRERYEFGACRLECWTGLRCDFLPGETNGLHTHTYHEICLTLSGHGFFRHGAELYDLGPGEVFVADPGVAHEIFTRGEALSLIFLSFEITFAAEHGAIPSKSVEAGTLQRFVTGHRVHASGLGRCADALPLLQSRTGSLSAWSARQAQLVVLLEMLDGLLATATMGVPGGVQTDGVDRALRYIEAHCCDNLCAGDIAAVAHVSTRTLSRTFKEHFGRGVMEVVRDHRLNLARQRLTMRRSSVAEVARSVGIESQAQFSKMFQRRFGIAPKEYQKIHSPKRRLDRTEWAGSAPPTVAVPMGFQS